MSTTLDASVVESLERTSKGRGTFPGLAAALDPLQMITLTSPAEFARFMTDLDAARKERERKVAAGEIPASEIVVKITDVESPRIHGIVTQEGQFAPRVFTSGQYAREYAVTCGLIQPDENLPMQTKGWAAGLWDFLAQGFIGCVIDDGTDHKINLDRQSMGRLYGYMTLKEFARLPQLYAVTFGGSVHFQRTEGGNVQTFVYDSERAAEAGVASLQRGSPGAAVGAVPTLDHLRGLLTAGVTVLVVNHGLPDTRFYNRDDLVKMVDLLGGVTRAAAPAGIDAALQPTTTPAASAKATQAAHSKPEESAKPEILRLARKRPMLPAIPPPTLDDVDAQMLFFEWKQKTDQRTVEVWEFLETLSYEMKLYALVHPRPVDGLSWPQFFRSPEDENKTMTYLYTSEEVVKKVLESSSPEWRRYLPLSGIEALRWIWAAPKNIDTVAIDSYAKSPAWITFPSHWAISAIYPHFYEVGELKKVRAVSSSKLGNLPGARGLKPEVARALSLGWRSLLRLRSEDGSMPTVTRGGKRYLPVFSDADRFFEFSSSPDSVPGKPESVTGSEPPFAKWVEESAGCEGVLLDPAGPHPLALDPTDLVVLDVWSRTPGRSPWGSDIIRTLAQLLYRNKIDEALAGRVAADLPRYWLGFEQQPDGGGALLMVPTTDACALFTAKELADSYLQFYQMANLARGMKPLPILSRWQSSAVAIAAEQFSEIWIDPDPTGGTGLRLKQEGIEAARARLDDMLKPRVPGFIVEA